MKWLKDALEMARCVRRLRKIYPDEKICLYLEEDIDRLIKEMHWQRKTYQLAYDCIEAMGQRKSRCRYCLEKDVCTNKKKGNILGCEDWVLKFAEVDDEQAATAEEGEGEQENQETGVPGDDARGEAGKPD